MLGMVAAAVFDLGRFGMEILLRQVYGMLSHAPLAAAIGALGLALIAVTLAVRLLSEPLALLQRSLKRRSDAEEALVAPHLAKLKKRFGGDRARLHAETVKLYQRLGVSPHMALVAYLPGLV